MIIVKELGDGVVKDVSTATLAWQLLYVTVIMVVWALEKAMKYYNFQLSETMPRRQSEEQAYGRMWLCQPWLELSKSC